MGPTRSRILVKYRRTNRKDFSWDSGDVSGAGALVAGAVVGGAAAHHVVTRGGAQDQAADEAPPDDYQNQAQYAPPPADPVDQIEHLAQLHASGALTDEEFAAAKAKALGT